MKTTNLSIIEVAESGMPWRRMDGTVWIEPISNEKNLEFIRADILARYEIKYEPPTLTFTEEELVEHMLRSGVPCDVGYKAIAAAIFKGAK